MESLSLPDLLTFVTGGGAAVLAFWLLDRISWLGNLNPEQKRYTAYVLTGGLAVLAWLIKLAMLYEPTPADTRAWAESLYSVAAGAIVANQLLHARVSMKKK